MDRISAQGVLVARDLAKVEDGVQFSVGGPKIFGPILAGTAVNPWGNSSLVMRMTGFDSRWRLHNIMTGNVMSDNNWWIWILVGIGMLLVSKFIDTL